MGKVREPCTEYLTQEGQTSSQWPRPSLELWIKCKSWEIAHKKMNFQNVLKNQKI